MRVQIKDADYKWDQYSLSLREMGFENGELIPVTKSHGIYLAVCPNDVFTDGVLEFSKGAEFVLSLDEVEIL